MHNGMNGNMQISRCSFYRWMGTIKNKMLKKDLPKRDIKSHKSRLRLPLSIRCSFKYENRCIERSRSVGYGDIPYSKGGSMRLGDVL